MAFPTKDETLVAYGANWDTRITASPTTFSLTAPQAAQFHTYYQAFLDSYNTLRESVEAGVRSQSLTTAKDEAKRQLLAYGRSLYGIVQSSTTSDADKDLLGVNVRKTPPSPRPAPALAPLVGISSVNGRTVAVRLRDANDPDSKARPFGTAGASVFSFTGSEPPSDINEWVFEGNTGRTSIKVVFDGSVAAGAQVFITAFWFNTRKVSSPIATPAGAVLGGASVTMG
jgi:hypothetical protein